MFISQNFVLLSLSWNFFLRCLCVYFEVSHGSVAWMLDSVV